MHIIGRSPSAGFANQGIFVQWVGRGNKSAAHNPMKSSGSDRRAGKQTSSIA